MEKLYAEANIRVVNDNTETENYNNYTSKVR